MVNSKIYNQKMKILIKNNSTLKLFNGNFNYQSLTIFIKKEFQLQPFQYTLTYVDEDGDNITLASNEDVLSAYELNSEKNLLKVKLNSNGATGEEKMEFEVIGQFPVAEQNIKRQTKMDQEPKVEDIQHHKWHRCGHWERNRSRHKSSSRSSDEGRHFHGRRFRMFHQLMNLSIAQKVDERVKNLIPCLKAQLEGGSFIKKFSAQNSIVHENTECKSCLATPIIGIRYKCLECPIFDICENCEPIVQHGHNLLKMKFVAQEINETESSFKIFKNFWMGHHGHHGHHHEPYGQDWAHKHHAGRKSHSPNSDKCGREERITRKLAQIFGGEAQKYDLFAKINKDLNKFEIINKYAADNGQQELLINFRCEKIAQRLKKDPQEFRQIVQNNMNLRSWELLHKISANQVENPAFFGKKCERKCEKYEHKWQKEDRKSKKSSEKKEKSHEKRQRSQQRSEKGKMLQNLISLFGEANVKEYFELIESHFSMGQEVIINKWLEAHCSQSSA